MRKYVFSAFVLLFVMSVVWDRPLWAESLPDNQRSFSMNVPYTGIVVGGKGKAEIEVTFRNNGNGDNVLGITLEGFNEDNGWDARLVSDKWNGYGITRVRLGAEKPLNETKVTLILSPTEMTKPGRYEGILVASSESSGETVKIPLSVQFEAGEVLPVDKRLSAESTYPVIENPAGSSFTYEISLGNKQKESAVVDFSLSVPSGWSGSVSPRWDTSKKIQSLKMEGNGSEKLSLSVTPPTGVEKGEYPVTFTAKSGDEEVSLDLKAVVTGTYKLKIMPETQRLNFETVAGTEKVVMLYVWNDGTAPVENVKLYSSKPDGWDVSFEPSSIPAVDALASTGKPEQVKMTVKAPERTIPGDYQIALTAAGDESNESVSLRATVKVPTTWGWFGIFIIAAVLILLFGTFWKLKRR